MRVEVRDEAPGAVDADLVGVPVVADEEPPQSLEERLRRRVTLLATAGELRDEPGSSVVLHLDGEARSPRLAAASVGVRERLGAEGVRTAAGAVGRAAQRVGGTVAWVLDPTLPLPVDEQARAAVEGIALGSYSPGRWKSGARDAKPVERIVLLGRGDGLATAADEAATVIRWTNEARDLVNAPPNELTPEALAEFARSLGATAAVSVETFGLDEIRALGMASFTAVAQGSARPAQLIVARYEPEGARDGLTLGLVGKAVTFDAGGISLKPALHMDAMKGDMAGGAAVLAALGAIAELALPVRTLAVVAATENMPGGTAFRPGDIVRAMNGKTIEITNTDAEGRLILADALWYAREQGATHLLDVATLTGAMELALGDLYAGVFANDDAWRDEILAAAEASGDHAWPFPLHPRYRRYIDSSFADMKNSSTLRQGSPALAAEFLAEFVGEGPWAHIDMAGPAYLERSRGDYFTQQGGTGYGVRLIVELVRRLA